jgi:hypothetical protein
MLLFGLSRRLSWPRRSSFTAKVIRLAILATSLLCAACGSYQLGTVRSPPGRTMVERDTAILLCKDEAKNAASTADMQAAGVFLGLTVIGYPAAYGMVKDKERSAFSECMEKRGYTVVPPKE